MLIFMRAAPAVLPLVPAMLGKLKAELGLYQRILTYWPQFGPGLEYGICAALRDTISATSRQCGLVQVRPHNCESTATGPRDPCGANGWRGECFVGHIIGQLGCLCVSSLPAVQHARPRHTYEVLWCLALQQKPAAAPVPQVPDVRESPRKLFGRKSKQPAVVAPPLAPVAEAGPKCVALGMMCCNGWF